MKNTSENFIPIQVSKPPAQPTLLYDGNCGFCRKWVKRWQYLTQDQVLYEPYQEAGTCFPEIDPQRFTQSLQLVLPNGLVLQGAHAVFSSLKGVFYLRWLLWSYERIPGFSGIAEWFYRKVAENRHRVWMNRACCKH